MTGIGDKYHGKSSEESDEGKKVIFQRELINITKTQDIPVMQFNKNAVHLLTDYYYHIRSELTNGILKDIREWGAKHFGHTQRIAGILHLCTHKPTELIDEDTAMKAINISMWAENQAHSAFGGTAFEDETTKNAKRVLKKLKEKKQAVYTRNDITRAFQNMTKIQIDDALELLDDMNGIRISETKTAGRPKITIKVNSLLLDK